MARIVFVVFSLALILSIQFIEGQSKEETPKEEVKGGNKNEDKKVTEEVVKKDTSEGLQDAANKGLVKDTNENLDASASPQQEEEFLLKIFIEAMTKMVDEGRMDPKDLKEKLFPGGGETIDPNIEPATIQALKDAISETESVETGAADSAKHAL